VKVVRAYFLSVSAIRWSAFIVTPAWHFQWFNWSISTKF